MVARSQIEQIENQGPVKKILKSEDLNQSFRGAIAKIIKFQGQLRGHMMKLKQHGPNWSLQVPN